ncbi:uncharacterized protein LOC124153843 [Ischnura elegans]|uniref:uncharacterized protein LOC124153843 n=1 Tax=Ischnura elegans TaxID=197161 RepID=UPI001ED8B8D4|nr:uncharacterized protein LOC124153843 [Ischnura elegans]
MSAIHFILAVALCYMGVFLSVQSEPRNGQKFNDLKVNNLASNLEASLKFNLNNASYSAESGEPRNGQMVTDLKVNNLAANLGASLKFILNNASYSAESGEQRKEQNINDGKNIFPRLFSR